LNRYYVSDNKLRGFDKSVTGNTSGTIGNALNAGISIRQNRNIEVKDNKIDNFHVGTQVTGAFFTGRGRVFSDVIVDQNTYNNCEYGITATSNANSVILPASGNIFNNVTTTTARNLGATSGFNPIRISDRNGDKL